MKEVIPVSKNDPCGEPGAVGSAGLEPFVERMLVERIELKEKINKLDAFIDGDKYAKLPDYKQDALVNQYNAMLTYLGVLEMRIKFEGVKI